MKTDKKIKVPKVHKKNFQKLLDHIKKTDGNNQSTEKVL